MFEIDLGGSEPSIATKIFYCLTNTFIIMSTIYKIINGTHIDETTDNKVAEILSNNVHAGRRLRFWYGDKETGKSWNEENDVTGYIGKSGGQFKVPLLIQKKNSSGGEALLVAAIVKIVDIKSKIVLYQHERFSQPKFTVTDNKVFMDEEMYAPKCKNEKSAQRLADFMNGKRMSK